MPTSGLAAYGPEAERYARSFGKDHPVVVFDQMGIAEALRDCATRRFRNQTFFARAILKRESTLKAYSILPNVLKTFPSLDECRVALEQSFAGTLNVDNQLIGRLPGYSPDALRLMQAVLRLADGLVVSSESERRRIAETLLTEPRSVRWALHDPSVPNRQAAGGERRRESVVIWAPSLPGNVALGFAVALSELRFPLVLVASSPPDEQTLATWMPVSAASEALARARLIVDVSSEGCDAAIPLASWGVPLVVDAESGAQEVLDGVRTYDARRISSVFEAVIGAIGGAPPRERSPRENPPLEVQTALLADGPLVSIVIPTLDRPKMLVRALQSIAAQSYQNIEVVVVVDGGPRIDGIAAEFPQFRFIHMPENDPLHSSNSAFSATRGEYVAFLNDDDVFFPNHIAELVTALERSGGSVAHGDVLTAFLRGGEDDWLLYGFESNMSRATDASMFLVSNQIGMTSCMFKRECIADDIAFEEAVPLYRDYALWLRLAVEYDFIHVERLTSCYTIRNDGSGQQSNMWYDKAVESYRVLYDRYPVADRPALQHRRDQVLRAVSTERMKLDIKPAGEPQPVHWPLWEVDSKK